MKRLLWIVLCACMTLAALAQKQQGIVRTIERPEQKSVGINGVTIKINEYPNAIVSGKGGKFSFAIQGKRQGDRCLVTRVEKKGYTLIDKMPSFAYSISTPVEIVMVSNKQLQQDEKRIRDKASQEAETRYNKRIAELERQLDAKTISEEQYREQLQQVFDGHENFLKMIDEMARRYAMTDYKGISEINRQIQECIENAELERADSLINSKGDIQQRKQTLNEKRGVKQKIDSLSLALQEEIDFSTNELASDFYNKYLICAARYDNDSAAYWLEQRAALNDFANLEWLKDAGAFHEDYLANYDIALEYYNKGLKFAKIQGDSRSEWIATFYNRIGSVYYDLGDYAKAIESYNKAINISENSPDIPLSITATSYNYLGGAFYRLGNHKKALEFYNKALDIREKVLDIDNPDVATSYNDIGIVYDQLGRFDKALEYYGKALNISESALGIGHPSTASLYSNIGLVYNRLDNYGKAFEYCEKALTIHEKVLGKYSPTTAISYNNISSLYMKKGDYSKALEYYGMVSNIFERFLGKYHPSTATTYNNLGMVYYKLGNYDQALEYYAKALDIREKSLGINHSSTADSYNNIGSIYMRKDEYRKALEYYQKSLVIREQVFGMEHYLVAQSYNNIGLLYIKLGDYDRALEAYQKALVLCEKTMGMEHAHTKDVRTKIDEVKKLMGE